jgi:hypothetical protein
MTIILELRYVFRAFLIFHMVWSFTPAKDDMHACFGIGSESRVLFCSVKSLFLVFMRSNNPCSLSFAFWFGIASTALRALVAYSIYGYIGTRRTHELYRFVLDCASSFVFSSAHVWDRGLVGCTKAQLGDRLHV